MDGAILSMQATPLDTGSQARPDRSDDHALVRASLAGDARAFEQLYRSHAGRVHGVILRLVGMDRARAEELTQEAFIQAWRKLSSFRFDAANIYDGCFAAQADDRRFRVDRRGFGGAR